MAGPEVMDLVREAKGQWHPDLIEARAEIGVILSSSEDGPAVTLGGYPCQATMRVIGAKDRLSKKYDAEMEIDEGNWDSLTRAQRLALVDHELSHLSVVRKCGMIQKDYLGRPKLKCKGGDWNAGDGFAAVVSRHGDNAAEFTNLSRTYRRAVEAKERGEQ